MELIIRPPSESQHAAPACRAMEQQLSRLSMRVLVLLAASLALAACGPSTSVANNQTDAASAATAGVKGVHREFRGRSAPAAKFNDPDGKSVRVADFKGRPLLVNLWASWCAPCVKELPTLDLLARTGQVQVIAISEDNGPHASVVAFLKEHQVNTLKPYQDPAMDVSGALGPDTILPTSILFDSNGKEVWRYIGDEDWTSNDAAKLVSDAAGKPS